MKTTLKFLLLPFISFTLFFNGCSSSHEIVSVSETHLYNNNYGVPQNIKVDESIANIENVESEVVAINSPIEVDLAENEDSKWTTELTKEEGTFLAEEYVQPEPVISYKYKFDKKFYDTPRWRTAEF
ncbi:MAG: hypothetical protein DSZ07_06785 [Sulfurovum sp.]|nr:MAG: hypothetical protein DSZ07_06785 [Sulfurovum sp.]